MITQLQDIQKTYAASRKKMDIVTVGWDHVDHLHFSSLAIFLCILIFSFIWFGLRKQHKGAHTGLLGRPWSFTVG